MKTNSFIYLFTLLIITSITIILQCNESTNLRDFEDMYDPITSSSMISGKTIYSSINPVTTTTTTTTTTIPATSIVYGPGMAIGWIGGSSDSWKTGIAPTNSGNSYQSFSDPRNVFVDNSENIFIAEYPNYRVSKWSNITGEAIGWIGGGSNGWKTMSGPLNPGSDYKSFYYPSSVFVDNNGIIYVADTFNSRISKWSDLTGNAIGWIGGGSNGWKNSLCSSMYNWGEDVQSFHYPSSVYIDQYGHIYVSDGGNHRVSKWSTSGTALGWIGGGSNGWKTSIAPTAGKDVQSFNDPCYVTLNNGIIYVADTYNHRISKWDDASGEAIGWIGGGSDGWKTTLAPLYGSESFRSFESPFGVFYKNGNLYIADSLNYRISKWNGEKNSD